MLSIHTPKYKLIIDFISRANNYHNRFDSSIVAIHFLKPLSKNGLLQMFYYRSNWNQHYQTVCNHNIERNRIFIEFVVIIFCFAQLSRTFLSKINNPSTINMSQKPSRQNSMKAIFPVEYIRIAHHIFDENVNISICPSDGLCINSGEDCIAAISRDSIDEIRLYVSQHSCSFFVRIDSDCFDRIDTELNLEIGENDENARIYGVLVEITNNIHEASQSLKEIFSSEIWNSDEETFGRDMDDFLEHS